MTSKPKRKGCITIVITVSTIDEREKWVRRIYTNLTKEPSMTYVVQQDRANRVNLFHKVSPEVRVLIRRYLVIVVPVVVDTKPLYELTGAVDFHLEATINKLEAKIKELRSLNGHQIMRGTSNGATLEQLVESLYGADGKY